MDGTAEVRKDALRWNHDSQLIEDGLHSRLEVKCLENLTEIATSDEFLRDGESHGVADIFNPEILEQMRLKHPIRKAENRMPDSLPIPDPSERLNVLPETVRRVYSARPRKKAQGASAWRYEMLTALAPSVPFASETANEA
ncbi:hypothetical protein T492DRAFT_904174, partial [Pavlovales sp. CCMP2436]